MIRLKSGGKKVHPKSCQLDTDVIVVMSVKSYILLFFFFPFKISENEGVKKDFPVAILSL